MSQNTDDVSPRNGARITSLYANKYKSFEIPFEDLNLKLYEVVQFPKPPLPENWDEMKIAEREAWMKEFRESEKGKAFIANNQKIQSEANNFDVVIEKDGKYVVYDVPPGNYGLRGRHDKNIKERDFAFEVFGQVSIRDDVEEVVLDPIMILVTPLLKVGQKAPGYRLKTHDNSAELVPGHFKGKTLFLNFWSTESPPSLEFQLEVQKMLTALKDKNLEVLSVNLDSDRKKAINHIREAKLRGRHGFTDGWDHLILESFGIRSIPSHWLINGDGEIMMTHMDFRRAFFSGKPDLATIVQDRMEGKDIPTPAKSTEGSEKK